MNKIKTIISAAVLLAATTALHAETKIAATPAATYAHQASRKSNYPIGLELVESNFDYFAGGALMEPEDKNKDKTSIYELATNAGYKVCFNQKSAGALKNGDKAIVIAEALADADSMSYDIDRRDGEWALRDYVRKGIEVLENKTGFFMMVEGGKVDWACHANEIYQETASSFLQDKLEEDKNAGLVLTDYELDRIKAAYEKTISGDKTRNQMEYDLYGTYEPLTITITHILNAKSGLGWTSNSHTGLPVPVFALGAGQEEFKGF